MHQELVLHNYGFAVVVRGNVAYVLSKIKLGGLNNFGISLHLYQYISLLANEPNTG